MKKISFLVTVILFAIISAKAQDIQTKQERDRINYNKKLGRISVMDSIYLMSLPDLEIPEIYKSFRAPTLPDVLDNSTQPYFRPPYNQAGYSCGQAALVGYNFTYEMNWKRNVPGNVPENQYPTHFTWNFMNAGNYYGGVSYYHSIEILRHAGCPNVAVYGGMSYGGEKRWINGYENYYHAMQNRILNAYKLRILTVDDLTNLKHWLHDHLNNSSVGGLASFYANQPYMYHLPQGTPEAGKCVAISWGYSSHALTIVGWNDSIRWDYNSDGQYTNNIDINGDGVVNLRDWEIGGFKFVNSYGGVPNWGDSGFCYMMYKTLADPYGQGGIWNNTVNFLKVKDICSPQLTMKITIKHTRRKALKVTAGLSTNISATEPSIILDFPIFDFQGGNNYMQGGTTEQDKTLEFGLDITPLLGYLNSGQQAKYFLRVLEYDLEHWGTGEIIQYSLMDYTNGVNEITCPSTNVPIADNDLTMLSIVHTVNFDEVTIVSDTLPPAPVYEPYSYQLNATGGTSPYFWIVKNNFIENTYSNNFPTVSAHQLIPSSSDNGSVAQVLDFSFPFYCTEYDTVIIHTDGFIKFDDQIFIWPYHQDNQLLFLKTKCISPYMTDLRLYSYEGDGIWYEGDENSAIFRWKISIYDQPSSSELNFAVKLFPSGDIEFYYGEIILPDTVEWYGGISRGDCLDYQYSSISGSNSVPEDYVVEFLAPGFPAEMTLSEDGVFSGIPENPYQNLEITFKATDNNNVYATRNLLFSTNGLYIEYTINDGNNNIIEFGDTVHLNLGLMNIGNQPINNVDMTISSVDTNITIIDSTQYYGIINPGQTVTIQDAFSFIVSLSVPDDHQIILNSVITSNGDTWLRDITLTAYAPVIVVGNIEIFDGDNGILDPGETADLIVTLENYGGAVCSNIETLITSNNPFIIINDSIGSIDTLAAYSNDTVVYNVTASSIAPYGYIAYLDINITADNNYSVTDTMYFTIGLIVEDFETGDFTQFPWEFMGDASWLITSITPYQGMYASKSGDIDDNEESTIYLTLDVLCNSEISFYKKVSSEANYDYLKFYIDGAEMDRWAGEHIWGQEVYPVTPGEHTFKWTYEKDYSVSNGSDCAWLDYILLPPMSSLLHSVGAGSDATICEGNTHTLAGTATNANSVFWLTSGTGTFDNNTILTPTYTPSQEDITAGSVILTIIGYFSMEQRYEITDDMVLTIVSLPVADAGYNDTICDNQIYTLSGNAANADSVLWITFGDGTFDDSTLITATYTPGSGDLDSGYVELSLIAYAMVPCSDPAVDTMSLWFLPAPTVTFDSLPDICDNDPPYELTEGNPPGGTYSGNGVTNGYFYPSVAGLGIHTITYIFTDTTNLCSDTATQTILVDNCSGIFEISNGLCVNIFPNPNNGNFVLELNSENNIAANIRIFSSLNVLVFEINKVNINQKYSKKINLSRLSKGVYFLKIKSNEVVLVYKIIIQN